MTPAATPAATQTRAVHRLCAPSHRKQRPRRYTTPAATSPAGAQTPPPPGIRIATMPANRSQSVSPFESKAAAPPGLLPSARLTDSDRPGRAAITPAQPPSPRPPGHDPPHFPPNTHTHTTLTGPVAASPGPAARGRMPRPGPGRFATAWLPVPGPWYGWRSPGHGMAARRSNMRIGPPCTSFHGPRKDVVLRASLCTHKLKERRERSASADRREATDVRARRLQRGHRRSGASDASTPSGPPPLPPSGGQPAGQWEAKWTRGR